MAVEGMQNLLDEVKLMEVGGRVKITHHGSAHAKSASSSSLVCKVPRYYWYYMTLAEMS